MKPMPNYFQYVCGTVFHDLPIDDKKKKTRVLEMLHCWENVSYESPMEITCYSSKIFKNLCFNCWRERNLIPRNTEFYPQCTSCQSKTRAKVAKKKTSRGIRCCQKEAKNIGLRYNSIHLPFDSSTFVNIFGLLEKPMSLVLFV